MIEIAGLVAEYGRVGWCVAAAAVVLIVVIAMAQRNFWRD